MKKMLIETLFLIIAYITVFLILVFGFFRTISDKSEHKLMVFSVGLMVVYVLVVGGVYWSDYVELR